MVRQGEERVVSHYSAHHSASNARARDLGVGHRHPFSASDTENGGRLSHRGHLSYPGMGGGSGSDMSGQLGEMREDFQSDHFPPAPSHHEVAAKEEWRCRIAQHLSTMDSCHPVQVHDLEAAVQRPEGISQSIIIVLMQDSKFRFELSGSPVSVKLLPCPLAPSALAEDTLDQSAAQVEEALQRLKEGWRCRIADVLSSRSFSSPSRPLDRMDPALTAWRNAGPRWARWG